jgi:anti-anti-sigma factor
MQIERREEQNGLALLLRGRLDAGRCRILEDELEDAIRQGFHRIVLDMDEVLFLSSAGIRRLLRYKRTLTALGGDLAIRRPSEFVREILNMVGMTAFFVEGDATAPAHAAEKIARFDLGAGSFRAELLGAGEARSFGAGSWGFGIGSFEKERRDSGEVLAAEGFALMLPPGTGRRRISWPPRVISFPRCTLRRGWCWRARPRAVCAFQRVCRECPCRSW